MVCFISVKAMEQNVQPKKPIWETWLEWRSYVTQFVIFLIKKAETFARINIFLNQWASWFVIYEFI